MTQILLILSEINVASILFFQCRISPSQQPTKCDKAGHYMSFNAVQLSSLYFG